jgi:hypothetical protein
MYTPEDTHPTALTATSNHLLGSELCPVLEAIANTSNPKRNNKGEEDAGTEGKAKDVGAEALGTELWE